MCAAGSPAPAQAISAQEAAQRADQAVFIDVREAHELDSGTIHEARHIPLRTLLDSADTITDIAADTPIIVYCQRGPRSVSAASRLVALGFTHVAHITGGIERWTDEYAQEARTRRTSTSSTKAI
jgi:rhodanese-related sulfurtransferase